MGGKTASRETRQHHGRQDLYPVWQIVQMTRHINYEWRRKQRIKQDATLEGVKVEDSICEDRDAEDIMGGRTWDAADRTNDTKCNKTPRHGP